MRNPETRERYATVQPTPEERAEWTRQYGPRSQPRVPRLMCRSCGKRFWGSGLGIGSHNRFHDRTGWLAPRFGR